MSERQSGAEPDAKQATPPQEPQASKRGKAGNGRKRNGKRTPWKFGAKTREKFLALLREGVGKCQAARSLKLDPHTPSEYAREHPEFGTAVEDARLESIEEVEDALFQAAVSGNVTACIFFLANRAPDRWRDVKRQELTGPDGGPIEHRDLSAFSNDELAAIAAGKRPR